MSPTQLADADAPPEWLIPLAILFACIFAAFAWAHFRERRKSLHRQLRRFLGKDYAQLQTHEKYFPSYDLPSLVLALEAFRHERCEVVRLLGGSFFPAIGDVYTMLRAPGGLSHKLQPQTFERMPVGPDEEASFPTSLLFLCQLRPEPTESVAPPPARLAVMLGRRAMHSPSLGDLGEHMQPLSQTLLSVACSDKQTADGFFGAIEERRARLCVFRGKTIDPVITSAGIEKIGFQKLKEVGDDTLVLPQAVEAQIEQSITGFYRHTHRLRRLGVEMKRCVLLHGPPGTGKTSIGLYLARRLPNFTVCFVSGRQLLFPRDVCRMARYLQPALVVFEDIDLVAEHRDANSLSTVLGELMNQFDGCEPDEQVLFLMNTNSLERLENALRNRPGRVDQIIALPLPDSALRRRLIERFSRGVLLEITDWTAVLDATRGATPATLKEVVKRAVVLSLNDTGHVSDEVRIRTRDLLMATAQVFTDRNAPESRSQIGFGRDPDTA